MVNHVQIVKEMEMLNVLTVMVKVNLTVIDAMVMGPLIVTIVMVLVTMSLVRITTQRMKLIFLV